MEDWIFFIHELRYLRGEIDELSPSKKLIDEVKANYHTYRYTAPYIKELIHFPGRRDDKVFAVLDISSPYDYVGRRWFEPELMERIIRSKTRGLVFGHRKHYYPNRIVVACVAENRARLANEIKNMQKANHNGTILGLKSVVLHATPVRGKIPPIPDEHPSNGCGPLCWPAPVDIPAREGDKILVPLEITIHDPDVDLREFEQRVRAIDEPGIEWATATDLGANNLLIACVVDDREKLRLMLESLSGLARSLKVDTLAMYSISHDSTAQ